MSLRIVSPGALTTVQDLGRNGFAHLGISPCGAADALAFRLANLAVGNDENAAALEMTLVGAKIVFDEPTVIAIGGASSGSEAPLFEPFKVATGFVLQGGPIQKGARSYLAIQGGLKIAPLMGSASTHLAGRFGGFGRPLRAGDVLDVNAAQASGLSRPLQHLYTQFTGTGAIRVTRGPQWEWFEFSEREQFLSCRYVVGEQSDRTGLRLGGPAVRPVEARQLLTEGVALGAIQVTSDGQPIILFVDQQTTGGYPKIANVAAVDLHRIGQLRPRDQVRFELISFEQAIALLREREAAIAEGIRA